MLALLADKWAWIEGSHQLRNNLLNELTSADLHFTPGGSAMTLGMLLREMAEVQYAYLQSLKTLTHTWHCPEPTADMAHDLPRLKHWFHTLDREMEMTLARCQNEEQRIMRDGVSLSIACQLEKYRQAQLIFFGKTAIYLKAMRHQLPLDAIPGIQISG